jgi:D-lactate dehydrogenase
MQTLITPHTAFATEEALDNIAGTTIANINEWLEGKPLTNQIQPKK